MTVVQPPPDAYLPPAFFLLYRSIEPGQMVNLGYMLAGPTADSVKVGDFKITDAEFCADDAQKPPTAP